MLHDLYLVTSKIITVLEQLITPPIPEYLLIGGGLTAVIIGLLGGSKGVFNTILSFIGFIVGFLMIVNGIQLLILEQWPSIEIALTIILGVGLFFRVFKKVPVALVIGLILAYTTMLSLSLFIHDINFLFIGSGLVFIVSLVILGTVETLVDAVGSFLGWGPICFVIGATTLMITFGMYILKIKL